MSQEFSESDFQYLKQEIRRIVKSNFDKLHDRLDRVEERARRKQNPPSRETESRSSRQYASKDYSLRDSYRDFYSTRNSRRSKASFEFEAFQGDERGITSSPSYAPRYSSAKNQSRRGDHFLYESRSNYTQRESFRADSFVTSPSYNERARQKEKEIRRKERQEMLMRENEHIWNEIERRKKEMKEKEQEIEKESEIEERNESVKETSVMEKEIEIEKGCEKEKEIEKEIEIEQKCEEKEKIEKERKDNELEKQTREKEAKEQEKVRNLFTKPHENLSCFVSSFQVSGRPSDDNFQLQYLSKERRFILAEKGNVLNDPSSPMPKGKQGMKNFKALLLM